MPNIVLVSAAIYRHGTARLPYALRNAGFRVWVLCPQVSVTRYSAHIDGGVAYADGIGVAGLAMAISDVVRDSGADAVVFCDELANGVALELLAGAAGEAVSPRLRALLKQWVGGVHACAFRRSALVERVRGLGIRAPRQVILEPDGADAGALAGLGSPILVKPDHGCGGGGIALAATASEALEAAARLRPPSTGRGADGLVAAQEFVAGTAASVSFTARGGRLLEAFAYRAVRRHPEPFGAASVIEMLRRPDLIETARRVVEHVAYSGFGGIDLILPDDGGPPVFLELNARPPQTTHLGGLFGADLARALACDLTGQPYAPPADPPAVTTVALFPAEWMRDPNSPFLHAVHHDVPWHDPRMASAIIAVTPGLRPG